MELKRGTFCEIVNSDYHNGDIVKTLEVIESEWCKDKIVFVESLKNDCEYHIPAQNLRRLGDI